MFKLALPIVLSAAVAGLVAASAPTKGSSTKKPVSKSAPKKSAAKKTASKTGKASSRSTSSSKKKSKSKSVKSWRTGQQQPTPERYREIQRALADRGYLQGPATGEWGPESVDALKRFQQAQNLKGDGKLDSLSLIALGLGPKRTANLQTRAQP